MTILRSRKEIRQGKHLCCLTRYSITSTYLKGDTGELRTVVKGFDTRDQFIAAKEEKRAWKGILKKHREKKKKRTQGNKGITRVPCLRLALPCPLFFALFLLAVN